MLNRFIKLLKEFEQSPEKLCPITSGNGNCDTCKYNMEGAGCYDARRADYLLKHGVIAPPCKVGDTVYVIIKNKIEEKTVEKIEIHNGNSIFIFYGWHGSAYEFKSTNSIGKTVFLTKEEAEQKMKDVKENENETD